MVQMLNSYTHVASTFRSCFSNLRDISKLRHIVFLGEMEKIIHAFVSLLD